MQTKCQMYHHHHLLSWLEWQTVCYQTLMRILNNKYTKKYIENLKVQIHLVKNLPNWKLGYKITVIFLVWEALLGCLIIITFKFVLEMHPDLLTFVLLLLLTIFVNMYILLSKFKQI